MLRAREDGRLHGGVHRASIVTAFVGLWKACGRTARCTRAYWTIDLDRDEEIDRVKCMALLVANGYSIIVGQQPQVRELLPLIGCYVAFTREKHAAGRTSQRVARPSDITKLKTVEHM